MSRFADCGRLSYKITENYKRAVTFCIRLVKPPVFVLFLKIITNNLKIIVKTFA